MLEEEIWPCTRGLRMKDMFVQSYLCSSSYFDQARFDPTEYISIHSGLVRGDSQRQICANCNTQGFELEKGKEAS